MYLSKRWKNKIFLKMILYMKVRDLSDLSLFIPSKLSLLMSFSTILFIYIGFATWKCPAWTGLASDCILKHYGAGYFISGVKDFRWTFKTKWLECLKVTFLYYIRTVCNFDSLNIVFASDWIWKKNIWFNKNSKI